MTKPDRKEHATPRTWRKPPFIANPLVLVGEAVTGLLRRKVL